MGPNKLSYAANCLCLMPFSTELLIALQDCPELCLSLSQMSGEILDLGGWGQKAHCLFLTQNRDEAMQRFFITSSPWWEYYCSRCGLGGQMQSSALLCVRCLQPWPISWCTVIVYLVLNGVIMKIFPLKWSIIQPANDTPKRLWVIVSLMKLIILKFSSGA